MSKLSELSSEQKSRWLAERIEPMPDGTEVAKIAWITISGGSASQFYTYQPCDFVNDPAMTLMLLKKLLKGGAWLQPGKIVIVWPDDWELETAIDFDDTEKLGQAVVDASMLQMGWKDESNES